MLRPAVSHYAPIPHVGVFPSWSQAPSSDRLTNFFQSRSMISVNVIIPTHGRPTLLGRILASLAQCHIPEGYAEAVVVENGSRAGAATVVADMAKSHPQLRLRYLHVERANKSHALNEAIATIGEGLVVFFDDDLRFHPGVLVAYADAAGEKGAGHYFGGSMGVDYEHEPAEWVRRLLPLSARGVDLHQQRREWHLYLGCNWAAFVEDIRAAGGFNPAFGPGSLTGATGQEADMQERLLAQGVRQMDVPNALVWHYVPKERSTLRWLILRKYRGGTQHGQTARASGNKDALHEVHGQIIRCALSTAKRTVLLDRAGWWQAFLTLIYWLGAWRGYHREDSTPAVVGSRLAQTTDQ